MLQVVEVRPQAAMHLARDVHVDAGTKALFVAFTRLGYIVRGTGNLRS